MISTTLQQISKLQFKGIESCTPAQEARQPDLVTYLAYKHVPAHNIITKNRLQTYFLTASAFKTLTQFLNTKTFIILKETIRLKTFLIFHLLLYPQKQT